MSDSTFDQTPETCGCCEGIRPETPQPVANRPGLPALRYRVGTHNTFLDSMLSRLSNQCLGTEEECASRQGSQPLLNLTTRSPSDSTIAMLDAWASVGDVLTFYQERIANEGYLRTALQRRSVLELARLVGYRLRPGVAASVFLAYEMEAGGEPSVIPRGARVQSQPDPGETAQTFETSADLTARYEWNALKPRQAKPLLVILENALQIDRLYFSGTTTNLKPNDPLLLIFDDEIAHQVMRRAELVTPDTTKNFSVVTLQPVPKVVPILVDLLQMAVFQLEKALAKIKADPNLQGYVPFVAQLDVFLKRILENLRLGNYPPDLSTINHGRIYSLLKYSLFYSRQDPFNNPDEVALVEEPLLEFLLLATQEQFSNPQDWAGKVNRRAVEIPVDESPASATPAEGTSTTEVVNQISWDDVFNIVLVDAMKELFSYISLRLDDQDVRQEITCVISNLIHQAMPVDFNESLLFLLIFSRFNQSPSQVIFEAVMPSLRRSASSVNFPDQEVLSKLAGIVWESGAHDEALKGLKELKLQAEILSKNAEQFPPFSDPNLKEQLRSNKNLDAAAGMAENLISVLGSVQVTKDSICEPAPEQTTVLADLITPLTLAPALHPVSPAFLARSAQVSFSAGADTLPRLLVGFIPALRQSLYNAWANARLQAESIPLREVHALRLVTSPFGYNAPAKLRLKKNDGETPPDLISTSDGDWEAAELPNILYLDSQYQAVTPSSYVVIYRFGVDRMAARADSAEAAPRSAYTLSSKSTRLGLSRSWWNPYVTKMTPLRSTIVYAQSENLPLADAPDLTPLSGDTIVLDDLYDSLDSGRWLIVSGQRVDIPGVTGVLGAELVMLLAVTQGNDPSASGDIHPHTTLTLSSPLSYRYDRTTVVIYANVVRATQGETRIEVLGNADGSKAWQQFSLRQPPLTYTSSSSPSGIVSTLQVRVNDLLWHETDSFYGSGPRDRIYMTKTDDAGVTTVVFGDGQLGARPPTGTENIIAQYRNGIGKTGNVRATTLKSMLTRPLHAKDVINPMPATGGADPDSRDQARRNVPKSVTSLGRLVSVQDYADFSATFAGVGKASASLLSDGKRRLVYVTIAGQDDIPIDTQSDLFLNLNQALLDWGDPHLPVRLAVRELLLMVVSAKINLLPDYAWEFVRPKLQAAMQYAFSFDRCEMGQPIYLSQVTSVLQNIPGVRYIDVQALDALDQDIIIANLPATPPDPSNPNPQNIADQLGLKPKAAIPVKLAYFDPGDATHPAVLKPAQLAYLTPSVPETLILNLREG